MKTSMLYLPTHTTQGDHGSFTPFLIGHDFYCLKVTAVSGCIMIDDADSRRFLFQRSDRELLSLMLGFLIKKSSCGRPWFSADFLFQHGFIQRP